MAGTTRRKTSSSTRKKSVSSKSKTSNRGKKSTGRKRQYSFDLNENGLWDEAILLLLVALAVILLLANFGIIGAFGDIISGIMFGLFGTLAYVFPICLLGLLGYLYINRDSVIPVIKITASVVMFVDICVLAHLFILNKIPSDIKNLYTYCKDEKSGGGILGGGLASLMIKAISNAGTWILVIFIAIVCFVLITEISVIDHAMNGSRKAYDMTREDARRYKERQIERQRIRREKEKLINEQREKEALYRLDKKVSGVSLDTTILPADTQKINVEPYEVNEEDNSIAINQSAEEDNPIDIEIKLNNFAEEQIREINNNENDSLVENEEKSDDFDPYNKEIRKDILNDTEFTFSHLDYNASIGIDSLNNELYKEVKAQEPVEPIKTTIREEVSHSRIEEKPQEVKIEKPLKMSAKMPSQKAELYKEASNSYPSQVKKKVNKYKLPSVELLNVGANNSTDSSATLQETAKKLVETLESFNVSVEPTVETSQGPSVTRYEMVPKAGVKVSKILNLSDDIKLALAAADVRIEAPIPGKSAIGIEVPNKNKSVVSFHEMMSSKEFKNNNSKIAFGLGKDIAGKPVIADIAKMPHLLIAGATGSGKSVCINTIIMSILYKADPEDVKLIMIDPKVVELSVYNGIPHLMIPVVTDPKKATAALAWGVAEMTERYEKFAKHQVRDLKGYNEKIEKMNAVDNDGAPLKKLPQIVIIVDELADLMMVASKEVEEHICRLAQLARACGIHLVIATQRPSVDVITGLIKANMPSRIAFAVSSGVDSRTILDMVGAEKLLGKGDMLYYPQGYPKPARIQGAFVSDDEVSRVVEDIINRFDSSDNSETEDVLSKMESLTKGNERSSNESALSASIDDDNGHDPLFVDVAKFVIDSGKATIGGLQRRFKIGFNRAARIVDDLSDNGIVGPEAGTKPREILMSMEQFEVWIEENL